MSSITRALISLATIVVALSAVAVSSAVAAQPVPKYPAQIASTKLQLPKNQCPKLAANVTKLRKQVKQASGSQKTQLQRKLNAAIKKSKRCAKMWTLAKQELKILKQLRGKVLSGVFSFTHSTDAMTFCTNGKAQRSSDYIDTTQKYFVRIATYKNPKNYTAILAEGKTDRVLGLRFGFKRVNGAYRVGRVDHWILGETAPYAVTDAPEGATCE